MGRTPSVQGQRRLRGLTHNVDRARGQPDTLEHNEVTFIQGGVE